jgi:hypothetical protein
MTTVLLFAAAWCGLSLVTAGVFSLVVTAAKRHP